MIYDTLNSQSHLYTALRSLVRPGMTWCNDCRYHDFYDYHEQYGASIVASESKDISVVMERQACLPEHCALCIWQAGYMAYH